MDEPQSPVSGGPGPAAEESDAPLREFGAAHGLPPGGLALLRRALTHRSITDPGGPPRAAPDGPPDDNERLEFLGDSILGMIVGEHLYLEHPTASEGELTRRRARTVSRTVLAEAARRLNLGSLIAMGAAEAATGGRSRPGTLADAFEAVLAAVYLSGGLGAARQFIQEQLLAHVDPGEAWDHKSRLQEFMQEKRRATPTYRIREQTGPAHDRVFVAEALVKGTVLGRGRGRSKKDAEQAAAAEALSAVDAAGRRKRRPL